MITVRPPAPAAAVPAEAGSRAAPRYAAAALVVAIVGAVDPGGLSPFGPARWAVASAGLCAVAAGTLGQRRSLCLARTPTVLFLAFVGWTCVTAALCLDPLYAWTGTPERHAGVLAWALCALAFVVGQALRADERRSLAPALAVAAVVAGGWATAEALGWEPLPLTGVTARPGGPFGSSAYLGAAAVLLGAPALGLAIDAARRRSVRSLGGTGAALAVVALVSSGARAAWGGALVAAVAVAIGRVQRRRRARTVAGGVAVLAVVVALAFATGTAGRAPGLVEDDRGGLRGRLDEWRVATRVVAAHPLVGVGPEGYRIAFGDHVDPAYERAHGRHPLPDRAHAALLDVAATTGLPGAALYAALLAVVAAALVRALRRADPGTAGVAAGVVAYLVQSLVLFPVPELDVVAWLLAGAVVGRTARPTARSAALVRGRPPRLVAPALGAAALVLAAAGVLDVAADRAARRTLDADALDAVAAARPGPDRAAARPGPAPDRAARLRPDALRYRLVAARALEATDVDAALDRLEDARHLSPLDPVLASERARLLLDRARRTTRPDHVDTARVALERLAARDPHNAETLLRLGLARALDGDDRAAERAWLAAERLAPRSAAASTNLAVAYARAGRLDDARNAAHRALARDPSEERARHVLRTIAQADGT